MAKTRTLLLAGTILAFAPSHGLAGDTLILAQAPPAPETPGAEKQAPKGQPKQQPPAAKGQPQPPAAQGQPPAPKGQPPAAQGQPPAPQPQRTQAPPAEEQKARPQRPAQGQPPAAPPPAAGTPPGGTPAARTPAPGTPPPAAQGQPSTAQPPQPSTTQDRPGQPQRPASRDQRRPSQPGQPPAQGQAPAAQGQPGQPPQPAAQGQPPQPQPPAAQGQPPSGQPPQPPTAQDRPGQRPASRDQMRPRETGQPPAQGQAPAARGQPTQPQPPAAQGQPAQPQPPAAQGQPAPQQPPTGQAQTPPAGNQPATATAPPAAQQPARPAVTERGAIAPQPTGAQGQPLRRVDDIRNERREVREGDRLVIREPDRVIVREGNRTIIRHNETNRFLFGGRQVGVDRRGAETTTIVERPDGTRIITVTDDDGRLIRRVRRSPEGREIIIIDNRDVRHSGATYYVELPPPVVRIPRERYIVEAERAPPEVIYETLMAPPVERIDRRYTLEQVRYSQPLRERMPRIDLDTINFDSGSWEIAPDQINRLAVIANAMSRAVSRSPAEVFLIEGHTDAVGADVDNLSLSDRRAESAALALTERFHIPPENLTTQGYGEQYLKVQADGAERQNRRVTVRRITPLLSGDAQSTGQAR
jgi:outer membrane protein OmpA-like peptidoglycan-associated protein